MAMTVEVLAGLAFMFSASILLLILVFLVGKRVTRVNNRLIEMKSRYRPRTDIEKGKVQSRSPRSEIESVIEKGKTVSTSSPRSETGKGIWWFPLGVPESIQIVFSEKLRSRAELQERLELSRLTLKKGGSVLISGAEDYISTAICFAEQLVRKELAVKEAVIVYCQEKHLAKEKRPLINLLMLPGRQRVKNYAILRADNFVDSIVRMEVDKIVALSCLTPQKIKNILLQDNSLILTGQGAEMKWAIILADVLFSKHGVVKLDVKTWSSGDSESESEIRILIGFGIRRLPPQASHVNSSASALATSGFS